MAANAPDYHSRPTRPPSPPPNGDDDKGQPHVGPILRMLPWLVLLFIAGLYVLPLLTGQTSRVSVPYSEFKKQVAQGNVRKVTIQGQTIQGIFETPYAPTADGDEGEKARLFETVKPMFEDPELLGLLEKNDVIMEVHSTEQSWFLRIAILMIPWLLFLGILWVASGAMKGQRQGMLSSNLFGVGKSRARRYHRSKTTTRFDDVAGLDSPKRDLMEIVEYLKHPGKFAAIGASIPKGLLLMGPPGTGKTLLARATAGEADVPFFSISGSEFIEMFVGVGASRVRDMFDRAKRESPSIIFIDEIDSIGRARGAGLGGGHDEREQTLNQILSEMDGFEPHESVVVIAATNRPDVLDPALIRPGRFDRQITLDLPQKKARRQVLEIHARKVKLDQDVDFDQIAARTVGFSGADLQNLVNEAALLAGRRGKHLVSRLDFEDAADRIMLGSEREDMIGSRERNVVAYHEAGHALIARLLPGADPLQKVSIIPRGRSLGSTQQIPEEDRHTFEQRYLLGRICVALGGRASEQLVFGEPSNGVANDLKYATQIARKMVCQWGMSPRLGPMAVNQGEEHVFLGRELAQERDFSERTARVVDEEIQAILTAMEKRAMALLNDNREALDALAAALLQNETLESNDVNRLVAERVEEKIPA